MDPYSLVKMCLPLAQASYGECGPPRIPISYVCDDKANCLVKKVAEDKTPWGFVQYAGASMCVAIRGTEVLSEWAEDANFVPVGWWGSHGRVHAGFKQIYAAISPSLVAACKDTYKVKTAVITGHSLGAALATLFAAEFAKFHPDIEVSLCTFESPRVGDREFIKALNAIPNLHGVRFANPRDCVTQHPSQIVYAHYGLTYLVDGGFTLDVHEAHNLATATKSFLKMDPATKLEYLA